MKTIMLFLIGILSGNLLFAQSSIFVTAGTIEYTRSVNMYAIARESMPPREMLLELLMNRHLTTIKKTSLSLALLKAHWYLPITKRYLLQPQPIMWLHSWQAMLR